MGCKPSKDATESPDLEQFAALAAKTPFTVDEVESLFELYKKLSNSVVKDGFIRKEELQLALFRNINKQSLFVDRMFDLFDVKKNGVIEFEEFIRTLSIFHPKTPNTEKTTCEKNSMTDAFRLYDLRGTGYIELEELKEMVLALLHESDLHLSNDIVDAIVNKTFKEADSKGDGKIDLEEWEEYVAKNPSLLKNMTLPYLMDITLAFPSFVLITEGRSSQSVAGEGSMKGS